jgi:hypothetical protein
MMDYDKMLDPPNCEARYCEKHEHEFDCTCLHCFDDWLEINRSVHELGRIKNTQRA